MKTETKTKEYVRPIPLTWWLMRPSYTWFMLRDATSVFIAAYCVILLVILYRAEHREFDSVYESLQTPLSWVLHLIALFFAFYHSMTFFKLTPRVLVVFRGDEKVPEALIVWLHYALWAAVTIGFFVIVWLV